MVYLRVPAAAAYLGVSKSFLDKARCYGGGPEYMRLGRAIVYSTADLDAFAACHRAANENMAEQERVA